MPAQPTKPRYRISRTHYADRHYLVYAKTVRQAWIKFVAFARWVEPPRRTDYTITRERT